MTFYTMGSGAGSKRTGFATLGNINILLYSMYTKQFIMVTHLYYKIQSMAHTPKNDEN